MSTETLVAETLNGLPASIEVVIPWSPELNAAAWWEHPEEFIYEFPTVFHSTTDCEQFIARATIDVMEAVLEGTMSLPDNIDRTRDAVIHRDGRITFDDSRAPHITMWKLVVARCGQPCAHSHGSQPNQTTFNREFAQYYAGLVAEQRTIINTRPTNQ